MDNSETTTEPAEKVLAITNRYIDLLKHTPKTRDGEYIYLGMLVWYVDECEDYPFQSIGTGVVDSIYSGDTGGHGTAMVIMRHGDFEGGNLEFYADRDNCPDPDIF